MRIQSKLKRKELIKKGKFGRYMAYAVGEILLVVIGILIALQINEWDQKRSRTALEKQYYQTMKEQLTVDRNELTDSIDYSNIYLEQYKQADQIITSQAKSETDTLGRISLSLLKWSDFRRKSSVYQTLVNTGDIKLISNQNILRSFEELETDYIYIERLESMHADSALNSVLPKVVLAVQISPFEVKDPDLLFNYSFHNTFPLFIGLIEEKNGVYQDAITQIDALLDAISMELNDLN
jgi:hypothetical protein